MLRAVRDAGLLSGAEYARRAPEERARLNQPGVDWLDKWVFGFAYNVEREADAVEALTAKPPDLEIPRGAWLAEVAAGQVEAIAGHPARGITLLTSGLLSCDGLWSLPRAYLRAKLYLGRANELTGDKAAACAAYAGVLERWGKAKPRSTTASEARSRATKLGCASLP